MPATAPNKTTAVAAALLAAAVMGAGAGSAAAVGAAGAGSQSTGAATGELRCRAVAVRAQAITHVGTELGVANRKGYGCVAQEDAVARIPAFNITGARSITLFGHCGEDCGREAQANAQVSRAAFTVAGLEIEVSKLWSRTYTSRTGSSAEHFGDSSIGRLNIDGQQIGGGPLRQPRSLKLAPGVTVKLNRSYETSRGIRQVALEVLVGTRSVLVLGEATTGVPVAP